MFAAFAWGFGAAASLLLGGAVSLRFKISRKVLGLTMAFGAGVLFSAVAYDLVQEAFEVSNEGGLWVAIGLAAGAVTFYVGDLLIDRMGGATRKSMKDGKEAGSPLAIVLGIILDGIPESIVIGLTLLVFMSNVPESIAATTGLRTSGWASSRIMGLWFLVALVSGAASLVGLALFSGLSGAAVALVDAFAAGAILTMLSDTMVPEAFEFGGKEAGLATTLGFGLAFGLTVLP